MIEVAGLERLKHAFTHAKHLGRLRDREAQLPATIVEDLGITITSHWPIYTSL